MHKLLIAIAFFAIGAFLVSRIVTAAPSPKATAPISAFAQEIFVDYAAPSHAGPGPDPTIQTNPCTGSPNTVHWATTIDGPGGALATASVCRNVATKQIVGFVVTVDSTESWATDGSSGNFDVENVASHELGHVAGLGHDNPPRSGCLTMYKFAGLGEIQKRTLGLGDKLGMAALYGSTDIVPGICGS